MNILPAPDGFCCRCGAVLPVDIFMAAALRCFVCQDKKEHDDNEESD